MSCPDIFSNPSCSGIGLCVADNTCACPPGYTGIGDFTYGSPSCSVFLPLVQALWGIMAAVMFTFQLPVCLWAYVVRARHSSRSASNNAGKSGRKIVKNGSTLLLGAVNAVALGISGLWRCISPLDTVGNNIGLTVVFMSAWTLAVIWGYLFTVPFLKVNAKLLGLDHKLKTAIELFTKIVAVFLFFVWATGPMLFAIMLGVQDATIRYHITSAFFMGNALACALLFGSIVMFALDPLIKEIGQVTGQASGNHAIKADVEGTLKRVSLFRLALIGQGGTLMAVGAFFAFVPLLNRAGPSYHQPLIMMSWACVVVALVSAVLTTAEIGQFPRAYQVVMLMGKHIDPAAVHTNGHSSSALENLGSSSRTYNTPHASLTVKKPAEPESARLGT